MVCSSSLRLIIIFAVDCILHENLKFVNSEWTKVGERLSNDFTSLFFFALSSIVSKASFHILPSRVA